MGTSLIVYAMELLDHTTDVYMWDGGLPQAPVPPWNYTLHFSIEGLTNEYFGDCMYVRDGRTVGIPSLEEFEEVEFPGTVGEAGSIHDRRRVDDGGSGATPGRLRTLQNKTVRYPGHFAQLKTIQRLGLLDLTPVDVDGRPVIPRHLLHALWDPQIRASADTRDLILIRILAKGTKDKKPAEAVVDLLHYYDDTTGFSAMEQGTGWHAAILTEAIAFGRVAARCRAGRGGHGR